ncbi:nitrite reductase small subunit NirD [Aeromicrobium massiliense]|uniref:nitrite reductase small subunit NirD n=1 Tax=Aeromicrobium massiliense TaxID=1464554 RepID=UPI0002E55FD1|nr:nitrite reductase small subunit NirD [Aeromicrobium massiliense]
MSGWTRVCALDDLVPDRGAAALVGGEQVALFRLASGAVHAVDHRDPFTGANVLARGLVGSRGELATVASPLHKQVFSLATGQCLDDPAVRLRVWPVRVAGGQVEVAVAEDEAKGVA